MRRFEITFVPINKFVMQPQTCRVTVTKETGDLGKDAKAALGLFIAMKGNLKKNEIIEIQEIGEDGSKIGLPITPDEGTSMLPMVKKVEG